MGVFSGKQGWAGRLAWAVAAGTVLAAVVAQGQTATTVTMPQAPLLPARLGAWSAAAATGDAQAAASVLVAGQAADVLREDGLTRSAQQVYTRPGRAGTLTLNALQFSDATGAVSAYTYLRSPEMRVVPPASRIGRDEAEAHGQYLFREGVSTVLAVVSSPDPGIATDLRALAVGLPKIGGPKGAPPLLPSLVPSPHLLPESVRYAIGPVGYAAMGGALPANLLGFDKSAETATAEYSLGGARKGLLTLLLLPTPEIAGARERAIAGALKASSLIAAGARPETAKLRREGPLVLLAGGDFTPAEAAAVVDEVHLRSEVTWNKQMPPEFHVEVRKTASLLQSILVLSGVLGLAAVLLGLFLGFGRAWIRVLMGKPAATEPEFLRLDLSGSRGKLGSGTKPAGL